MKPSTGSLDLSTAPAGDMGLMAAGLPLQSCADDVGCWPGKRGLLPASTLRRKR
jgi:hypothetical protein